MKTKKIDKKDFIWNFLGLTINSFNSLFFLIIVNRVNGAHEAGVFTYAYSIICLFYFIGVYYGRTYQVANNENKYNNREFIFNRFFSCFLMFLVTLLFVITFRYSLFKATIILLICLFRLIEALADIFLGILQKKNKLYKAGFSLFIKGILCLLLFTIVDYFTENLILSCLSLIIGNLIVFILYDIPSTRDYIKEKGNFKHSLQLFKSGFPIFIFSMLNIYLVNSSKYTLDFFETSEIQNVFGIILMPGTILSLCCQYLLNPYILQLTNYYNELNIKKFNKILLKVGLYIVVFGILAEIICLSFGIPVLNLIYKIDLSNYKSELLIVIVGAIFLALISIISSALTIMKKNVIQMYIFIFDSTISFVLSIYLVKSYSLIGASITYTSIMVLQFINCLIAFKIYISKLGGETKNEGKNK